LNHRASELGAFEFITKPVAFDRCKAHWRQLSAAAHLDDPDDRPIGQSTIRAIMVSAYGD